MTKHIISTFKEQSLYWQPYLSRTRFLLIPVLTCDRPEAVGKIIVGIEADPSIIGKAYYIEGGDAWQFEDTFLQYQPQWLGVSMKSQWL
jgi:hypothetical protein